MADGKLVLCQPAFCHRGKAPEKNDFKAGKICFASWFQSVGGWFQCSQAPSEAETWQKDTAEESCSPPAAVKQKAGDRKDRGQGMPFKDGSPGMSFLQLAPPPAMLSIHDSITGFIHGLGERPCIPPKPRLFLNVALETKSKHMGFRETFISKSWQVCWELLSYFLCQLIGFPGEK